MKITSDNPILEELDFKPYRHVVERQAKQFLPETHEEQTRLVETPWGETLTAKSGDYIVNEVDTPEDCWSVEREIFEETYMEVRPGYYVKSALTYLAPLTDVTNNPEQVVFIHTLEGTLAVRAGDFYLARGVKGEIWPFPREKVESTLTPWKA